MPELPEVETMRRGILGAQGGSIVAVEKIRCRKKPLGIEPGVRQIGNRIVGLRVLDIDRIGKRVVLCLGMDRATEFLVFEPRMTGLVLVSQPPTEEHLRFRLLLGNCDLDEVLYWDRRGLGNISLLNQQQLDEKFSLKKIGPDALQVEFEDFLDRFSPLKREIKVALLDQKLIAGIGNLYASEMLHAARIAPTARCESLSKRDYRRVFNQMRKILETAIQYEGSTLADGTYRNALNQSGGYQNHHQVYAREGEKCPQCKRQTVERIVQAQRATFFCPQCQPDPND